MKIKVITRHSPSNYGSLLQSIATIWVIEHLGHDCEIINYQRKDERGLQGTLTALSQKVAYISLIKKIAYVILRYPLEKLAEVKFDKMRSLYLNLTKVFYSSEEIRELTADVFMTGSDQVWGPLLNGRYDKTYFLPFVKDANTRKVAYASSFGRTDFNETTVREYIDLLNTYDGICVREDSAVKMLSEWGVPCLGQVLDPTLLLDKNDWGQFIKKEITGEYILIYQIHNNKQLDKYAEELHRITGIPLVRVSPWFHQIVRGGKFVFAPDLGVFLSYIKNCTYMVTDSFHGTAFAINFNKQFIEILPNTGTGNRNQSILELTGLQDRIVTDLNDFSIKDRKIDYTTVNQILLEERGKSITCMKKLIEGF